MGTTTSKSTKSKKPTFEVAFRAVHIVPEDIPLRTIGDSLRAIQRLASGRDPDSRMTKNEAIGLMRVRRGSAVYACHSRLPEMALKNLRTAGAVVDKSEAFDEHHDFVLKPLRSLSSIARELDCTIVVSSGQDILTRIDESTYKTIAKDVFVDGAATILATLKRVGGATKNRCAIRIPGRQRLMYCDVASTQLSRQLGPFLYQEIAVRGRARWIGRTWRLFSFRVDSFYQRKAGSLRQAMKELRDAGGDAWDNVADPEAFIRELRE